MVEYQRKASSGVSKAALATAIGAGVVALGNGGLGGIMSPFRGAFGAPVAPSTAFVTDPAGGYVTDKEMCLIRENSGKDAVIARMEAERYADNKVDISLAPVYAELNKQKDSICALQSALTMETERRSCGDENLLTYINGNFIPAEKSLNSCHINYHGVRPVIRPTRDCCDSHPCHDFHND